ncbi:lytic transglycosylase domain-containing protein [Noviherbaspirillum sp. ST9]|uniref:lytic transglycosylase domain-containing protein n=1 Tax=Noviherbaspirillum sp. ST9 TaxID=3401606 RepID=UPI003B587B26
MGFRASFHFHAKKISRFNKRRIFLFRNSTVISNPLSIAPFILTLAFGAAAARAQHLDANTIDNTEELVALGNRYQHGEGVARDLPQALAIYCRAAKLGHAQAFYEMGWMYANARGVERDDGMARHLFEQATKHGHQHAAQMLQHMPALPEPAPLACLQPEVVVKSDEDLDEHPFPRGPIFDMVNRLAPNYGVDPRLALAVISVESGFQPKAVSPKNAQGLMQLMPQTAQRFRVRNAFDPEDNVKGGLAYLRWLLAYFQGNVTLVAAAYNAGERAVESHGGIPPFAETKDYVRKITRLYRKAVHPFQSHVVDASPLMTRLSLARK